MADYQTIDSLTAKMVKAARGNEISVKVAAKVFTVRGVGPWFVVRDCATDRGVKCSSMDAVRLSLAGF